MLWKARCQANACLHERHIDTKRCLDTHDTLHTLRLNRIQVVQDRAPALIDYRRSVPYIGAKVPASHYAIIQYKHPVAKIGLRALDNKSLNVQTSVTLFFNTSHLVAATVFPRTCNRDN